MVTSLVSTSTGISRGSPSLLPAQEVFASCNKSRRQVPGTCGSFLLRLRSRSSGIRRRRRGVDELLIISRGDKPAPEHAVPCIHHRSRSSVTGIVSTFVNWYLVQVGGSGIFIPRPPIKKKQQSRAASASHNRPPHRWKISRPFAPCPVLEALQSS